jgi:uncharacterized protein YbbK (DUF523 family)
MSIRKGGSLMIIVSACLAGLHCRYDGGEKSNEMVIRLVAEGKAIPVCPEQLGGLTTPRLPCEITNGRVMRKDGVDVTAEFKRGAREALTLAELASAKSAILKARSPSCGCGLIYDGSFSEKMIPGDGIFSALCKANGIDIRTDEDL